MEETAFIQQDNANSDIGVNDIESNEVRSRSDLDIRLLCHPSHSPDFNVLDQIFLMLSNLRNSRESFYIQ